MSRVSLAHLRRVTDPSLDADERALPSTPYTPRMHVRAAASRDVLEADDPAELGRLGEAITRLLPPMEEFLASDGPDVSVTDRAAWTAALDRSLPDGGQDELLLFPR